MKFNLTTSLPAGTTAENVSKASLKLFVNRVAVSGLVDVYRTSASWTEKTITHNNAPAIGSLETSFAATSVDQYVVVDHHAIG